MRFAHPVEHGLVVDQGPSSDAARERSPHHQPGYSSNAASASRPSRQSLRTSPRRVPNTTSNDAPAAASRGANRRAARCCTGARSRPASGVLSRRMLARPAGDAATTVNDLARRRRWQRPSHRVVSPTSRQPSPPVRSPDLLDHQSGTAPSRRCHAATLSVNHCSGSERLAAA